MDQRELCRLSRRRVWALWVPSTGIPNLNHKNPATSLVAVSLVRKAKLNQIKSLKGWMIRSMTPTTIKFNRHKHSWTMLQSSQKKLQRQRLLQPHKRTLKVNGWMLSRVSSTASPVAVSKRKRMVRNLKRARSMSIKT